MAERRLVQLCACSSLFAAAALQLSDSDCLLFPFMCCPQDEEAMQLMQQPQIPIKPTSTPLKADESEVKVAETGAGATAAQPPAASS